MREDIIFAGFGGQGIMFMGKVLSYAAMKDEMFVTWMPSYGAEVRGGTAHSMVIISDTSIASPVVREPSICVAMNNSSVEKFEARVKSKGLLIVNRSLADTMPERKDIEVMEVPATDMAFGLGDVRVANMITLGALLARKGIVPVEILTDSLKEIIPRSHRDVMPINKKAVREGYKYGSR